MKLSHSLLALPALLSSGAAFSVAPNQSSVATTTRLNAEMGRREMVTAAAFSAGALLVPTEAAFAAEYKPRVQDMQQIYFLGASLDKLVAKLEDPTQIGSALSGIKAFNKEPSFYSGYAKNFIGKSVKKGADNDPRVGYIKQASTLISSIEGVLEGGDALMNEKDTTKEAIARVKKAQGLIAKFIAECGVEQEEKLAAYVSSHKL